MAGVRRSVPRGLRRRFWGGGGRDTAVEVGVTAAGWDGATGAPPAEAAGEGGWAGLVAEVICDMPLN